MSNISNPLIKGNIITRQKSKPTTVKKGSRDQINKRVRNDNAMCDK